MSKKRTKNVVYQKFDTNKTMLMFPYPPVYQDQNTDYICYTNDMRVCSNFWKIQYVEDLENFDLSARLADYKLSYELLCSQIQTASLFSGKSAADAIVTIPSLEEFPRIAFDWKKIIPTADEQGNYISRKNPEYTNGKYHGRPLLLTIGVPVSNQVKTIERCLLQIKPLLDELDAELLVIDTGSTDGTVGICKSYGARVLSFPWCDNMSAVRNEGIYQARGEWYLSIDDDEWFEDVNDILDFFQSGAYEKYDTATYIQRNYLFLSGKMYSDNHVLRLARITPDLHFEGRIHDAIMVPKEAKNCQLFSYVHHYSFVGDDREKVKARFHRNVSILLYDVYEYPKNLRYNFQLANELKCEFHFEMALAYFFRGISMEMELQDAHYGRLHIVELLSCLHQSQDVKLFAYTKLLKDRFPMTAAEKAFLCFNQAELASILRRTPEEILNYYDQYDRERKAYEKDPYDSQLRTYLGLQACTNESYMIDAHVLAFSAYMRSQQEKKALAALEKISIEKIFNHPILFYESAVMAGDKVYQSVIDKMPKQQWEKDLEELMDTFLASICRDDIYRRQIVRYREALKMFSVQGICDYMYRNFHQLTDGMRKRLYEYAVNCKPAQCTVQELFVYGYVLKDKYMKLGKKINDRKLFQQYALVMGEFASSYYHPSLLEDTACRALSADLRAIYQIYLVLRDYKKTSQNIRRLKEALLIFPGFKSEIQYLLGQMVPQEPVTQPLLSPQEEMAMLSQMLKKQVAALLKQGKAKEAVPVLKELAVYVPDDRQVKEMLAEAEILAGKQAYAKCNSDSGDECK